MRCWLGEAGSRQVPREVEMVAAVATVCCWNRFDYDFPRLPQSVFPVEVAVGGPKRWSRAATATRQRQDIYPTAALSQWSSGCGDRTMTIPVRRRRRRCARDDLVVVVVEELRQSSPEGLWCRGLLHFDRRSASPDE